MEEGIDKNQLIRHIIETPNPLSEEQKSAVLSKSRYLRIVAGAGTGKTETMTRRVVYLILCENALPGSIVVFTFTEKAAQSIKSRIYERVRQLGGEEKSAGLGDMFVGTIHSFCFHLLEDKFGYGNFSAIDKNKEMAFLMREGWSLGLGSKGNYGTNCERFLRSVDVVYNELIDINKLRVQAESFSKQFEKYEATLNHHKLINFGQMISRAVHEIESKPDSISYIKHLIVDEYQDINRAQDRLIKLIGKKASVFIVGDPRQCIYQWRGSDEKCFDEFTLEYRECEQITIRENRRSVPEIVDVANTTAAFFAHKYYEPLLPIRKENGKVVLLKAACAESEAAWVINQIKLLIKMNEDLRFRDFAILLRSVKTSGRMFIERCKEESIPFIVGGNVGLFQRDEAQAVGRLIAWLDEDGFWYGDQFQKKEIIKGENLLISGLEKWKIAVGDELIAHDIEDELREWKTDVFNDRYPNFSDLYQELLRILGFLKLNPENKMHAALMANLGRFNTLLTDYETSIRLGGQKLDWKANLKGLCWFMNSYAIGSYEENYGDDIRGVDAVQIMTVHQAKGLEWPVVFVPCLTDKRFPSSNTGKQQEWLLPRNSGLFPVERYEGNIEDEKRLFYVAITRARDLLCLSYFKKIEMASKHNQSHSIFLSPIDKTLNYDSILDDSKNIPKVNIMPASEKEEIQTFSATEIIYYRRCPFMYRLREIFGFQPGLDIALGFGRSLHYCLSCAIDLIKTEKDLEKMVNNLIEEKFHLPFAGGNYLEIMKNKAKKLLYEFIKQNINDLMNIKEVEARLEFPIEKATVAGKIDAIIKVEGERELLEIRDYKTSDKVESYEDSSLQLQIYALGLRKMKNRVAEASIAYLDSSSDKGEKIKGVPINDEILNRAERTVKSCIDAIRNGQYNARCGAHCNNCDYRTICRYS
ncbi:MAG: ATP-dependent helicase [Candidatus Aminicenantes bacterium]|nr:ATP-dependent helicase [Candidatus Aminicenantes bacterium]